MFIVVLLLLPPVAKLSCFPKSLIVSLQQCIALRWYCIILICYIKHSAPLKILWNIVVFHWLTFLATITWFVRFIQDIYSEESKGIILTCWTNRVWHLKIKRTMLEIYELDIYFINIKAMDANSYQSASFESLVLLLGFSFSQNRTANLVQAMSN